MSAPVTMTETRPSTSGSAAAASDPKTTRRMSATIGKPTLSAVWRSLVVHARRGATQALERRALVGGARALVGDEDDAELRPLVWLAGQPL